jgi:hypothetical protein
MRKESKFEEKNIIDRKECVLSNEIVTKIKKKGKKRKPWFVGERKTPI